MSDRRLQTVLQHVRTLAEAQHAGASTDDQLLAQFVRDGDEAAFAALVHRHAAMVLGVCRRIVRNAHDAEDACQAAFLVLARKASSIRKRSSVGSWLHGVAFRVARKLQGDIARRSARQVSMVDVPQEDTAGELTWREVQQVLDEELHSLPKSYGAPLVLCYLEGKTQDEAARALGWTLPTLRGRLERGRERLRGRLSRRGITFSAALIGTALTASASPAAVPATLIVTTVKAGLATAAGRAMDGAAISARVVSLTEGVVRAMSMTRATIAAAVLAAVGILGTGASLLTHQALAQAPLAGGGQPGGGTHVKSEGAGNLVAGTPRPRVFVTNNQVLRPDVEDVWTVAFRPGSAGLLNVDLPGRGQRRVLFLTYEVVNDTGQPRTVIPELELQTSDKRIIWDEVLPTLVKELARKLDPAGTVDFKNSVTLAEAPLAPSTTAPPRSVRGIATWDVGGVDCRRFTIFIAGLSNAWSVGENAHPPGGRRAPVIQRKTLQLEFKQVDDPILFMPPGQWVYRATKVVDKVDDEKEPQDDTLDQVLGLRRNMLKHIQEQADKREKADRENAKTRQAAREIERLADALAQGERQRKLWQMERDEILLHLRSLQEEANKKKQELDRKLIAGELEDTIRQIDLELMKTRLKSLHGPATRSCAACHVAMDWATWLSLSPAPKAKDLAPPATPQDVLGKVVRVDDKDRLVEVNIGTDQGLRKDQTLEVFRLQPQPEYLGKIRLVEVLAAGAVGRVETKISKKAIQPGDHVAVSIVKQEVSNPRGAFRAKAGLDSQLDREEVRRQHALEALKDRLQKLQQLLQGPR